MVFRGLLFLCVFNFSILNGVWAHASEGFYTNQQDEVLIEAKYNYYYKEFSQVPSSRVPADFIPTEDFPIALDAIEDAIIDGTFEGEIADLIPSQLSEILSPQNQVRWFRLQAQSSQYRVNLMEERALLSRLEYNIVNWQEDPGLVYEIIRSEYLFHSVEAKKFLETLEVEARNLIEEYRVLAAPQNFVPPSAEEVKKLFLQLPPIVNYQNGSYANLPRMFLFCRHNRAYPCLFLMKDKFDKPLRVNGKLWWQPALAKSSRGIPFNQRSGNTPQGVMRVDGVMPTADALVSFGKFRRLILNFVTKASGEKNMKFLLPSSSHNSKWWKESVIARDVGRNFLRIHGTGQYNKDPHVTYYPFIPTSGCISQREGKYNNITYIDQRRVLDTWMRANGLPATVANEPSIAGLLYIIDIDAKDAPVAIGDLEKLGIR